MPWPELRSALVEAVQGRASSRAAAQQLRRMHQAEGEAFRDWTARVHSAILKLRGQRPSDSEWLDVVLAGANAETAAEIESRGGGAHSLLELTDWWMSGNSIIGSG